MAGHHILINGLSLNLGGAGIVAREIMQRLPRIRPDWTYGVALIKDFSVHDRFVADGVVEGYDILWGPPKLRRWATRPLFERRQFANWVRERNADLVLQLNGMIVPGLSVPTLCHFQDPQPYRPEAWTRPSDRIIAWLKRRENHFAVREAACCGWVSHYLHDLVCDRVGATPRRNEILPNGIPDEWIERARGELKPWGERLMEIVTVSTVRHYKRQELVLRAVAELIKRPGLESLRYRLVGSCTATMRAHLESLARELGIGDRLIIEGLVPYNRIPEFFEQARCFALMSVSESFGIPAIEAMCHGTPVVTTDCCSMPEVCGDAAELVPIDDLGELIERLARVLTDKSHAERLQQAGLHRVEAFHWSHTVSRFAELIEEIVQS